MLDPGNRVSYVGELEAGVGVFVGVGVLVGVGVGVGVNLGKTLKVLLTAVLLYGFPET